MIRLLIIRIPAFCLALAVASCSATTESLIGKLKDANPKVRLEAIEKLGDRSDPAAIEPLVDLLQSSGDNFTFVTERTEVCAALSKIGGRGLESIRHIIEESETDIHTSSACIDALGRAGPSAVEHLAILLDSKEMHVAMLASTRMSTLNDPASLAALKAALRKDDGSIRGFVASALARRGVIDPIVQLTNDNCCKKEAGATLVEIRSDVARSVLEQALNEPGKECVVAGAHSFYVGRGEAGSEQRLIAALKTCGDSTMARAFINSGNDVLSAAGEEWKRLDEYVPSDRIVVHMPPVPTFQPPPPPSAKWGEAAK